MLEKGREEHASIRSLHCVLRFLSFFSLSQLREKPVKYQPNKVTHLKERSGEDSMCDVDNNAYVIFFLLLIFFIKAYVAGTH